MTLLYAPFLFPVFSHSAKEYRDPAKMGGDGGFRARRAGGEEEKRGEGRRPRARQRASCPGVRPKSFLKAAMNAETEA